MRPSPVSPAERPVYATPFPRETRTFLISTILAAVTAAKATAQAAGVTPRGAAATPPAGLPIAPAVAPQVAPQTWIAAHAAWLTHGLAGIFMIASVVLVVLLALQTTKAGC